MNDDFATFLNRSFYEKEQDFSPVHKFYRDQYAIPRSFQHHNPLDDTKYRYICRSVDRLRTLVRDNVSVLCLLITDDWKINVDQFSSLAAVVSARMPSAKLVGISVHAPTEDLSRFGHEVKSKAGDHILFDYHSIGRLGPLDFDVGLDNVNLINLLHRLGA